MGMFVFTCCWLLLTCFGAEVSGSCVTQGLSWPGFDYWYTFVTQIWNNS